MPIELGPDVDLPQAEEDVKFLPSGKIIVIVDGKTHSCRRPKLGEFRHFREVLYEEQDASHEELLAKADRLVEEQATDGRRTPEEQREELRELVRSAQKVRADVERQETTYLKWCREVVEALSGRSIEVEDDELPFQFATHEFVTAVQRHWRTIPLPSGAR